MSAGERQGVFVGGTWSGGAGEARAVLDPSNEETLATVADASVAQVDAAVAAARGAQREWSLRPAIERGEALRRLGDLIEANADSLAATVTAEVGKPAEQAAGEVGFATGIFRYTAEWARRLTGEVLPSDERDETINLLRVPIGTVAAICAWNFPLALFSRKVAPALLAGNTVVAKPSELTPLAAIAATELAVEAGIPAGVLNLVCGGPEVGRALVRDPRIGMVTMTGSTRAGRQILADVAENMTRVSLELGGKAPAIVLGDSDLGAAVADVVGARHLNSGQVCTCAEVVYVEHGVVDEFAERYAAAVSGLRVGDPRENPDLGPLAGAAQLEKVGGAVEKALAGGATALVEGGPLHDRGPGYWFAPVVLRDVDATMPVVAEEIFGPVTPIVEVGSMEEAIAHANASPYGLSAYLYTNDYGKAMRAARDLDCGELYINRSIGEALQAHHSGHRQSGMGGEDGYHGLLRYTQMRSVYHHFGPAKGGARMAFDKSKPPGEAILGETPEAAYSLEFGKTYVAPEEELPAVSLSAAQGRVLAAWADRLIPAEGEWPAAGAVGAGVYADNSASRSPLQRAMLLRAVDLVERQARDRHGEGFADCTDAQRDAILADLEAAEDDAVLFDLLLELIFEGYYRAAPVLAVVEARTGFKVMGPVEGVEIEAFDESLLQRVKGLPPRRREVPA